MTLHRRQHTGSSAHNKITGPNAGGPRPLPMRTPWVIVLLLVVALAVPFFSLFYPMMRQMHAGRHYMDSLTDVEIQKWIDRSKDYLAHVDPNEYPIGARPVPSDLKALKILRIDLRTNSVV
jgi:hypothetical protein